MKRKRLLLAVALVTGMLGWNSAQAQTDVTNTYIKNAGFEGDYVRFLDINTDRGVEKPNGWSVEWYQTATNDQNGQTFNAESINQDNITWSAKSGKSYFSRIRWANATIYLRQTLSNLRPGDYTLSFSAATHTTNPSSGNSLTISVAGQSQTIAAETNGNGNWSDYTLNFSITSTTPYATIEIKGERQADLFKFGIDEFKLTYDGSSYYETILNKAQTLLDDNANWAEDTNNALSTAITSNSGKTTIDDKNAAIVALEEAMATYKTNNSTDVTNLIVNATFDNNISGWTCEGGDGNNYQLQTSTQTNFQGGFLEKWRNGWNGGYNQKDFNVYQNLTSLPKGEYTIKAAIVAVMEGNKEAFAKNKTAYTNKKHGGPYYIDDEHGVWLYGTSGENSGKAWANTQNGAFEGGGGEYKTATVNVTDGNLTIGFKGVGSPNGGTELGTYANWIACDNWTLSYFGFDPTVLKANLQALQEEATELLDNGTYSNVSGAERTSLATLSTATPEETKSALETAIQNIEGAIAAFTAAKPNYDALVAEIAKATALGANTSGAQAVAEDATTTASSALAATQDLKVAEYNYVTGTYQYAVELGTWKTTGPTGSLTSQHWSGEARPYLEQSSAAWGQNSWTIKYEQDLALPAGNYVFKVAGRQANSDGVTLSLNVSNGGTVLGTVSDFPKGDTGRGIDTSGATNFSEGTYANNNAGRGWEWRYVKFTLDEDATVKVAVDAVATTNHMWVSFCDATVQTDNEANISLIAYNIALNDAKTTCNNETDYPAIAQYPNASENIALQEAIAADETLDKTNKEAIDAATETLKNATAAFIAANTNYQDALNALNEASAINPEDYPYADPNKTPTGNLAAPTTAEGATQYAIDMRANYRKFVESHALAEGVEGAENKTDLIINPNYTDNTDAWGWTITQTGGNSNKSMEGQSFTDGDGKNDYHYYDYYNGANANQNVYQTVENVPAGRYLVTATMRGAVGLTYALNVTVDGTTYSTPVNTIGANGGIFGAGWNDYSAEFEVLKAGDVELRAKAGPGNGAGWTGVTRWRLVKIADIEYVDVEVTAGGELNDKFYATFSSDKNLDFSAVEGLTAYYVTSASKKELSITPAETVPAGTAVLLEGAEAKTYQVPVCSSAAEATNNQLQVSDGTVKGNGTSIFVLGAGKNGVGFYLKKKDSAIAAGKAYLEIEDDGTGETKSFISLSGDDATAISNVEAAQGTGIIYNLNGQRVAAPVKGGLYIMNGKKVLVK